MRTIAITNFKGGVSKTTTTATLAYLASQRGLRLLLIDADSQGDLSRCMGVTAEPGADTLELLENGADYYPEFVTETSLTGVDIIPSGTRLLAADLDMADRGAVRSSAIAELRDAIEEDAGTEGAYNAVLIDCPPALSAACIAALRAADEVIIPVQMDGFSIGDMADLVQQLQYMRELNYRLRVLGVLVVKYTDTPEERQALAALRDGPLPVFDTVIRYSKRVPASTWSPDPLPVFSPNCAASRDYKALTDEIFGGGSRG